MADPLLALSVLVPAVLMAARYQPSDELDHLFAQLRAASSAAAARLATERIWTCWMHHDDAEICTLLEAGVKAMSQKQYDDALTTFDAVVARDPTFPEGWNKRATVRYLLGDYAGAVRDIKETLALEPRHFGALAGLGAIYLLIANSRGALNVFETVLTLNPHLKSVRQQVQALRQELDND